MDLLFQTPNLPLPPLLFSALVITNVFSMPVCLVLFYQMGFPGGSDGKESTCNAGDLGWIPGLGRSSGGGQGNQPMLVFLPGESP